MKRRIKGGMDNADILHGLGLLDWATIRFGFLADLITRDELADIATRCLQGDPESPPAVASLCMCKLDDAHETAQQLDDVISFEASPGDAILLDRWRLADLLAIFNDSDADRGDRWSFVVAHYHAYDYPDLSCVSVVHPEHLQDKDEFDRALLADIHGLAERLGVADGIVGKIRRLPT